MIYLEHFTYTYPGASHAALADVTLHIAEGEFALIAGPSGVGKSTLLRSLNGLVPHFTGGTLSGGITVAGHDPVTEGPQVLSRLVGFVFQDPEAQFVLDRVEDEIAFALENAAMPPAEMRVRVEEVLSLLDLAPLRNRSLETLSGGERQRVAIAAALAFRPRILALDEPTSQLDPQSAEDVLNALVRLNTDMGLTIVLAEHRLERVLNHVDRLIYLRILAPGEGKSEVLSGPPRQVLHHMDLTPPLVTLGKKLGWEPLPLTIKEGRAFATECVPGSGFQASGSSRKPETAVPTDVADVDAHAGGRHPDESRRPTDGGGQTVDRPQTVGSGRCVHPKLQVSGLSFSYDGVSVLRDVTLSVGAGELVALMGRNGSGKTTLLKCVVGLLRPKEGQIALAGESLIGQETAHICQRVSYLPQEPDDLLFADTVADELVLTLRNHGLLDAPPIAPAKLLDRLGLGGLADSYPRDLSVGERQRVALGAVTVTRPGLLLLDEPTRGMDYVAKRELVRLLREWQSQGVGVLLVTHDVELAAQAADRVVILSQGEVIADDSPDVLTVSPLFAPQVARLFPGTGWLIAEDALSGLGVSTPR
jgi:energy-coupling factor transporter ATP-binding protein EcfA2